ncbi:MAG: NAD(P)H-dependent oxidoreductase [Woeseiaceae bacterium]|nr:NAD(P)H-dependent oxidoreductase [Woeseiaceae bacterium]
MKQSLNVLAIYASARKDGSVSRTLSADLLQALEDRHGDVDVVERDLADGLPYVDAAWIEANFTADEDRTDRHRKTLAESDALVAELEAADVLVIGAPIYNFSIPAVLKAWIDMITRARLTFRYTENGPEGLLKGKKAFVVVPSGGVPVGSPVDFSTPYLTQALGFVGISDVEFIGVRGAGSGDREALDTARSRIAELVHLAPHAA